MPTIQQILDYTDRKYPNQETISNKVSDLDSLHKHIFVKIAKLKNEFEQYETISIANQLTYLLPDNCTIDNIISVKVSQDTGITSAIQWDTYEYAGINDDTTIGYRYGDGGNGLIALLNYDEPINSTGYNIRITYFKRPNALLDSSLSAVPELNEDYHDLLKYGLIQELASQGNNPDADVANYWQAKFDEFMRDVKDSLSDRFNKAPTQSSQAEEYW